MGETSGMYIEADKELYVMNHNKWGGGYMMRGCWVGKKNKWEERIFIFPGVLSGSQCKGNAKYTPCINNDMWFQFFLNGYILNKGSYVMAVLSAGNMVQTYHKFSE